MHQDHSHFDDLALAKAALVRDQAALETVGRRLECVPRMLGHINSSSGRPIAQQDFPDLVQGCLAVIWSKLERFEGLSSLETWVFRICSLEFMNQVRRARRLRQTSSAEDDGILEALADSDDELIVSVDLAELLRRLGELDAEDQQIIRMRHYDDLTFKEIGARLNITTSKAKARYYRGIRLLQARLRKSFGEEA